MQDYIDTARIEASGELDQKYIELIEKYDPEKHPGVAVSVLTNRLHCNVWKGEVDLQKRHMSLDQAKVLASTLAGEVLAKYRNKFVH